MLSLNLCLLIGLVLQSSHTVLQIINPYHVSLRISRYVMLYILGKPFLACRTGFLTFLIRQSLVADKTGIE